MVRIRIRKKNVDPALVIAIADDLLFSQVETNSEAEASTADEMNIPTNDTSEVHNVEAQETVESSEPNPEIR